MSTRLPGSYRKYTPEEKEEAIKLALELGGRQAALRLGLPHRMLARWASRSEVATLVDGFSQEGDVVSGAGETREDLAGSIVDEVQKGASKHMARLCELQAAHDLLANSSGVLMADGYNGYNGVVGEGKRLRPGCGAHARRGFFEARKQAPEAAELLELSVGLYGIEHEAADAQILGTAAARRRAPALPKGRPHRSAGPSVGEHTARMSAQSPLRQTWFRSVPFRAWRSSVFLWRWQSGRV